MNTEHIEKIFTDYIKTDKTQYAILLNGSWGCGKTYFWKYTLDNIAQQNEYKTIYISLNGISKIDVLDHQLFIKLLPIISNQENKTIKNTTTLLGNLLNKLSGHFLKASLSDIFKGVSIDTFNFSKYIICFDDLERCQIPIKEVFGFVNNFVEHKHLKTIILANESEVDKKEGYERIKEKVIGRDIKFELNIRTTLPHLFEKHKTNNTDFFNFLVVQQNVIADILVEYRQDNLRIIGFYLDTLEKIYPTLKNVDETYVQEIILFSALIAIEFKLGCLTTADYNDFKGIEDINEYYYSLNLSRTISKSEKEEPERTKSYAEIFCEKYLGNRVKTYFFYSSIYSYILSGYFNPIELKSEINKRYPEVIPNEVQDFRRLLHYKFRELPNEDFKKLTRDVLQYAKEGKYWIYDYVQIANFFYFFSSNKLVNESKEDIDKILMEGLEIAKAKKQINDRIIENLLHFGDDNPDVTQMKKTVKTIHDDIKKEEYVADSNELIDCLANKDEIALASIFEKHQFSKELFQYTNEKRLLDTISIISNRQLFNFTELLRKRYDIGNIGNFLFGDVDCLSKIKNGIIDYLKKNENIEQPRKFLFTSLEETLIHVIQHINDTRIK